MLHQCRECLRMFSDDSGPLPQRDCVHCVFCGAAIPLPRAHASDLPPFSSEVERQADVALGVLGAVGSGFPDTLRQFRIRQPPLPRIPHGNADSLAPLADGDAAPREAAPAPPWWGISFWTALGMGFAVGGLLAYGAALSARAPRAAQPDPAKASAAVVASAAAAAAAPVALASPQPPTRPSPSPVPPAAGISPSHKLAARVVDPMQERRFALERARAEQRRYRLAEAERLYRQLLARAPHDSEALAGLGELELLRGTTDLAQARFQEALAANQDYVPARIAVADLEWQAGHVDVARQAYREIVERYAGDLYPPYVSQRSSVGEPPQCDK